MYGYARRFRVVRKETVERNYECARCGVRAVATLRARGDSGWRRKRLFDDVGVDYAREDARISLQDDADRIMALMRCPACRARGPRGVFWSAVRLVWRALALLFVVAVLFVAGELGATPLWLAPAVLIVGLAFAGANEFRRWREAARAERTLAGVKPGAPDRTLPRAIARERPAAPPAPLEPLRTSAPEQVAPASLDDGPSFLR